MNALPIRMRDRWSNRAEPTPDRGRIYWHMLMHTSAEACAAAKEAQEILARFPGLHMTPRRWLHITTLVAGSTDEITRTQMLTMVSEARRQLGDLPLIPIVMGRVLYHPEAVMLRVQPGDALRPILNAAQSATRKVVGHAGSINESRTSWTPHMTVAYSTTEQPAEPILSALGTGVQERQVLVNSLTLVVQWGPERLWNWEPIGTARMRQS